MMSQDFPQQTRRRRSDKYQSQAPKTPQRAGYQEEEAAPLPLGGYDATPTRSEQVPPPRRPAPGVYDDSIYNPPAPERPLPGQPVYEGYYDDEDYLPPRRWPLIVLLVVMLLVAAIAIPQLFPKDATGFLGKARGFSDKIVNGGLSLVGLKKTEPPQLLKFDTPASQVQTGVKTVFTFTANKKIDGVRIFDEVNTEIRGVAEAVDAPGNTTWTLSAKLEKAQNMILTAEINVDGVWYQTDKSLALVVVAPTATPAPTFTPEPVFTPIPTQSPAIILPTQELGLVPTSSPEVVASQEPQGVTLVDLLPAFSAAPQGPGQTESAELPPEVPPQDNLTEFPEEELPKDMLTEAPEEEFPEEELPEDMLLESSPTQEPVFQAPATPTPMPVLTVSADEAQAPDKFSFTENAYIGGRRQTDYTRPAPINMQAGDKLYTYYEGGVFTFRGDGMRQNAAFGQPEMPLDQMSIRWESEMGSLRTNDGTLYGLGWTGQPAIVKWSVEVRSGMNLNEDKKGVKALKEVIAAAQDGKVYFLDLADGLPTRDPIDVGYPLKGSVSVDPFGRPLIAFGQGVSIMPNKTGPIGMHLYNLIDQSKAHFINGRKSDDQVQYSTNGAFDGTGLFDRNTDTFIAAGENGLLYTVTLNTVFDFGNPTSLTIDPETVYLRAKGKQQDPSVSVESSPAMYGQYAFYADRQGLLRAVDTTTMKTLWVFDLGDNTDATPALDLDQNGGLALYTGTTIYSRSRNSKEAVLRRMDALSGREIWAVKVPAKYDASERGGLKASPVVGQGSLSHLVIFTVNLTDDGATILALNKDTGAEAWRFAVPGGAISSPVAVYTQDGRARLVQASLDGRVYLLDAMNGSLLHALELGGPVEGSPVVYNDMLVIGTSGKDNHKLYGIRLE